MNADENPWKTLSGKRIYDNPWIRVDEFDVINPGGSKSIYGKVSFKNLAIAVIPVDEEGYTWLVGQYRYTLSEYSWEVPMGGVPENEDIEAGALRELREETGLSAGKLDYLCKIHTSNSVTDEVGHIYVARELTQGKTDFDETEDLEIRKVPFREALNMVLNGEITDSLSMTGILRYAREIGL
jgi:8-oxo-dGTP pyrophosphatase MutT (NUDIX family)